MFLHQQILLFIFWKAKTCQLQLWFWSKTKLQIALMLFLIWADEKYNNQKNPCVVLATQKNPGVFQRPKKIPFGQNVRPKKILGTPPRHWNMRIGLLRDGLNYLKVIFSLRFISSLNLFTNNKALKCYNLPVPLALLWSWANSILPSTPAWTLERDKCMALANCSSSSSLIPCPNKQASSTSS